MVSQPASMAGVKSIAEAERQISQHKRKIFELNGSVKI
jgi:hypothetical protein